MAQPDEVSNWAFANGAFEFPEFPAQGPKLASILDAEVPDQYTLTDQLWN